MWKCCDIPDLIGVGGKVVKFFGGSFGESQLKKWFNLGIIPIFENEAFELGVVDITKGTDRKMELGITGRPEAGIEIPDVKKLIGANGAAGITTVARTNIGVALAFEEDGTTPFAFR